MIARRMQSIDASGIRKVFDLAQHMDDPVNLSIGQPDFDIPEPVKQEAITSIQEGFNRYTVTQGIPELRQPLAERLKQEKGVEGEILITSGASGALLLAFMVLVDQGDEVLIPDPYFVMYKHLVNLVGGVPKFIDTYPHFRLEREALEAQLSERTKLIVVNSPANPTGVIYRREELELVAAVAEERGLLVISDEVYDAFAYDAQYESIAPRYEKTLVVGGFSKSHAMTGWRLGYAVGPQEVIAEMTKLQQFTFVCAPSFAQKAGAAALDCDTTEFAEEYRKRRDRLYEGLKDNFEVQKPEGAFYMFPKAPWGTGLEFVETAIKNNLLIIPGSVFSERDTHFRIVYAASMETIERGIEILNRIAERG